MKGIEKEKMKKNYKLYIQIHIAEANFLNLLKNGVTVLVSSF